MAMGERHVVDDADIGHLEAHLVAHLAGPVDGADEEIIRGEARGLVAEGHHLAGERVELRMGGEGLTLPAALEIPGTDGLQRVRIDLVRQPVLLGHEQLAGMNHGGGVGHGAQVGMGGIAYRGIIGVGIAVVAVQLVARLAILLQPVRVHEPALEIHLAALEAKAADIAVGIEDGIVGKLRRVIPLVSGAVERPVQIRWDLAGDLAVLQRDFESQRRIEPAPAKAL